jgi:site-specific recombinase
LSRPKWLRRGDSGSWDLSALLNAAEGLSGRAQRHLWLARLMEWLRHAPRSASGDTPPAILRLRHLLNVLEKNPEYELRLKRLFVDFWSDIRSAGLFSDYGFGPRMALYSEIWDRLRLRILPATPDTRELAELFPLLFEPDDAQWLRPSTKPRCSAWAHHRGAAPMPGPTVGATR